MGQIKPDLSFERDGRPLADWLLQLVSDERADRHEAAEALGGMWMGLPRYSTDWEQLEGFPENCPDFATQQQRFAAAVRTAVDRPGFPTAEFVRGLCFLRVALQEDWLARVGHSTMHDEKYDQLEERLIRQMVLGSSDAEREQAARRFAKAFCASMARDQKLFDAAEAMSAAGMVAHVVFDALDTALLADPQGLWAMLRQPQTYHQAAEALVRIGPPAEAFGDFLLEQLDAPGSSPYFDGAAALGAIAQDNPTLIDALLTRLRGGSEQVRPGTAATLEHIGPHLAGREDEAVALLLEAVSPPDVLFSAIGALGAVGRDREDALQRVLELARHREPKWESVEWHEDRPAWRYDRTVRERGEAINALRYFQRFADRVVPVLLDAFDTFEEYDPDYTYNGAHERVCGTLQQLGPAAAPAVPRLIAYLEWWQDPSSEERDWPKDALQALKAMGPAAAAALPVLNRWAERERQEEEGECPEDLAETIQALRGEKP